MYLNRFRPLLKVNSHFHHNNRYLIIILILHFPENYCVLASFYMFLGHMNFFCEMPFHDFDFCLSTIETFSYAIHINTDSVLHVFFPQIYYFFFWSCCCIFKHMKSFISLESNISIIYFIPSGFRKDFELERSSDCHILFPNIFVLKFFVWAFIA